MKHRVFHLRKLLKSVVLMIVLLFTNHLVAQIQWESYPELLDDDQKKRVKFGYLPVPENRLNPESRTVYMAFVVVKNTSNSNLKDAMLFLPGGPGQGYTSGLKKRLDSEFFKALNEKRDIVFVDPRGCGRSYPSLCEDINTLEYLIDKTFEEGESLDAINRKAMTNCAEQLARDNADVHGYSSMEVAHDVEVLRKALGYDQWNVRGQSYGSNYGFYLMQSYPETIRCAVLSGIVNVEPIFQGHNLSFLESLSNLIAACANDPDCKRTYPNFEEDVIAVLNRIDDTPVPIVMRNEAGFKRTYFVKPRHFLSGIFEISYSKKGLEFIPGLMASLKHGNDWIIQSIAEGLLDTRDLKSDMLLIISSNDYDPKVQKVEPNSRYPLSGIIQKDWLPNNLSHRTSNWDFIRTKDSTATLNFKILDIPTLFVSGKMDPITPPNNAKIMRRYLPNSRHHVIPSSGHFSVTDILLDYDKFIDNPNPNIDIKSISDIRPLRFVTNISPNKGVSQLMTAIDKGRYQKAIFLGICLSLLLIVFLGLPMQSLVMKLRRRKLSQIKLRWLLWSLSLVGLLYAVVLAVAIQNTLQNNPYVIVIGVTSFSGILKISLLLQLLIVLIALYYFKSLRQGQLKVPAMATLIGSIGFLILLGVYGFIQNII